MSNLTEKIENYSEIDSEWFSYHIMMSQFYDPTNKTSQHVKYIIEYLNIVSEELFKDFPYITKNELIRETYLITSSEMIKYFEKTPKYKKIFNCTIN